ncbi:MAG: bifunctional 4-hydroxy-2-oxoglutarate aldolase/2-dehydro-3-deoxy-phosphogluconate aldolase [Candidatus Margulisbacteria bacterium]|nr:bifunctional 4-hydroxy-2-oxoglutarate aldolase/2-dehydro-3-deoxy-phosphogluconate aldolase [Candidatus Margulisiibacteriota bacterium]
MNMKVLGILRGVTSDAIEPIVETAISSGLETIEITMNTPDAPCLIKKAIGHARGRLVIGAGTVLNRKDLAFALEAGASFIVMPVIEEEVIAQCVKDNIPVFPGALTPNEIFKAWSLGAAMVKVFPAKFFGPKYFKEINGPFNDIKLLACGGVTPENKNDYLSNGASAISFGSSVFRKEWLAEGDFDLIGAAIKAFIA